MTLDEAIRHELEVAETDKALAAFSNEIGAEKDYVNECKRNAENHKQLVNWLKELKAIREYVETLRNFNTHNCYIEEIKNIVGRNDE